ncbi:hypothetical protein BSFG_01745 [Bacteroides sp. 4_3_47FAA]|nr:hypothetical protein BSFG_01745 [Bacteroides sp. 4_3_47FAA]
MKKSDILFFLFVIALFLPFFISDTIYEWYKSFNAIHGMVMSFVKFAILATLGEMLGLRISTGVYHNKTFGIIPRMVIVGGYWVWVRKTPDNHLIIRGFLFL